LPEEQPYMHPAALNALSDGIAKAVFAAASELAAC
jgi:hypothetical protein